MSYLPRGISDIVAIHYSLTCTCIVSATFTIGQTIINKSLYTVFCLVSFELRNSIKHSYNAGLWDQFPEAELYSHRIYVSYRALFAYLLDEIAFPESGVCFWNRPVECIERKTEYTLSKVPGQCGYSTPNFSASDILKLRAVTADSNAKHWI